MLSHSFIHTAVNINDELGDEMDDVLYNLSETMKDILAP